MPDLLVNGCVITRATHWWFSPCCLPRASPQVWLWRSRVEPRNLHCDFYGSGKDRLHWPTPQQGLQGLLQRSPLFCPSSLPGFSLLHRHHRPRPSHLPAFVHAVPPAQHTSPSHSPLPSSSITPSRLAQESLLREACLTAP